MAFVMFYEHVLSSHFEEGYFEYFLATFLKFWKSELLAGDSRTFRSDQGTVLHTK